MGTTLTPESTSAITTTVSPVIESTIAEVPEDTVYDIADVESTINGIPEQTVYVNSTNPTTNEEMVEKTIDAIDNIPESTTYLPKTSNNTILVDNFNSINNLSENAKLIRQNILDAISNKSITLDGLVLYFKINKPSVYSEAINKISENYANLVLNNTTTVEQIENELFGTVITIIDFEKALNQNENFTFYTNIDDIKYTIYINGINVKNGVLRYSKEIEVPFANNESLECCILFEKDDYMPCSINLNSFSLQNRNINIELQRLTSIKIDKISSNEQTIIVDATGAKFKIFKNLVKHNGSTYLDDFFIKYTMFDGNNIPNTLPGKLVDILDTNIKLQALLYIEYVGINNEKLSIETNTSTFNEYIISTNIDSADLVNIYDLDFKYAKFKDTEIDTGKTSENNIYTYQVKSNKSSNVILFGTTVNNARSCKIRFLNTNSTGGSTNSTLIGKQIFKFNYKGFNPNTAKCFDTVFNIPVTSNDFIINNNITLDNNSVTYEIGALNLLKNEKNSTEYLTIDFSTIFENKYSLKLNLLNSDKFTNFPDTDKILFNCDLKDAYIFSPNQVTVENLKLKEIITAPLNDIIYKGTVENLKLNGIDITGNVIFTEFLDLKNTLVEMRYFDSELKLYYKHDNDENKLILIGSTLQECSTKLLEIFNDTIGVNDATDTTNAFKITLTFNEIDYFLINYNNKMWFGDIEGNIINENDLKNSNNITIRYNFDNSGNYSILNIPLIHN